MPRISVNETDLATIIHFAGKGLTPNQTDIYNRWYAGWVKAGKPPFPTFRGLSAADILYKRKMYGQDSLTATEFEHYLRMQQDKTPSVGQLKQGKWLKKSRTA